MFFVEKLKVFPNIRITMNCVIIIIIGLFDWYKKNCIVSERTIKLLAKQETRR